MRVAVTIDWQTPVTKEIAALVALLLHCLSKDEVTKAVTSTFVRQ